MNFSIFYQLKSDQFKWVNLLFYFSLLLLLIAVGCYGIFELKVYLVRARVNQLDAQILRQTSPDQKMSAQKVMDYKKKIDDFSLLVNKHRISSQVFSFLEKSTLPGMWFSSLNMSAVKGEINLLGQADSMETLNNQIRIFEADRDHVLRISVLNSQVDTRGNVKFVLSFLLNPKVFEYANQ